MHERSIKYAKHQTPGKTLVDHATWVAGRTVDYVVRKNLLGRETAPTYNKQLRLKDPEPVLMTDAIKKTARWIGADLVGIAELNPAWVYTCWGHQNSKYSQAAQPGDPIELPADFKWVIVLVNEMGYEYVQQSPAVEPETDLGYSKASWCAASLATFITELGYRAIPAVNELGISVAMAVDAGLGEMGRHGQLITREFGPRVRISKVFTNLPLVPDSPVDLGIQKFCENCALCAKYCPGKAIPAGPRTDQAWDASNVPGMKKWPIKAMSCLDWWVKNGMHCSVCVRVCPWNKPDTFLHRFVKLLAERNVMTSALVYLDERLGYGKQARPKALLPTAPVVVTSTDDSTDWNID
jgi:reductive dehalogenase